MFALCEWVWWVKLSADMRVNQEHPPWLKMPSSEIFLEVLPLFSAKNHYCHIKDKGRCVQKWNFMRFGIMHFLFGLCCLEFCRLCQLELLWSQIKGNTCVHAYVLVLVIVSPTSFFTPGIDVIKSANLSASVSSWVWLIVIPDHLFHIWNGNLRLCWQPMSHKPVY